MVFLKNTNRITVKSFGKNFWLPKPHILLETKLNSITGRDEEHKKLKDIADIFALLWFSGEEIPHIKSKLLEFYREKDVKRVISTVSKQDIKKVSGAIGVTADEIKRVLLEIMI
jgi:hypothetical protein